MTLMTRTTQWLCAMSSLFGGLNNVLMSGRPWVWTLFKGLYTVSSLKLGMSGRPYLWTVLTITGVCLSCVSVDVVRTDE
jgi:hypothetical protein